MWRNLSKNSSLRKLRILAESHPSINAFGAAKASVKSILCEEGIHFQQRSSELGIFKDVILRRKHDGFASDRFGFPGNVRGYAAAAEAIASTSEEEVDEIQELVEQLNKEIDAKSPDIPGRRQQPKMVGGMGLGKYNILRRRQIKVETEAWEEAAKEYQELLVDMCEQKLAPNLPYIKSLFLGWFEPLRDAIAADQDSCQDGKNRAGYAPYFDQLPADMMAVITMHKLMALLMTGGGNGSARVVQAACHIGEAVEHEVGLKKSNCNDHIYLFNLDYRFTHVLLDNYV